MKRCAAPGCPQLTDQTYCSAHRKAYEAARGTSAQRGYNGKWRAARAAFLALNPACVSVGCGTDATVVDHIKPHRGNQSLFWDQSNWQSLCASCHGRKTARSDGRWGASRS
jgi:5-methylcytosine-specific restriction protein A